MTTAAQQRANIVYQALKNAGIPANIFSLAYAQAAMESAVHGVPFSSPIALDDNNYSGILFSGNSNQKNATKSQLHKLTDSNMWVAHFATVQDWANDFKRILSLGQNKPIDSTSSYQYFTRLKANNYFGKESTESYAAKVMAWFNKIKPAATSTGLGLAGIALFFLVYKILK